MRVVFSLFFVCLLVQLFGSFRKGKDYALFFAVKDYEEWTDLRNPISDAEAIAKELASEYDFDTLIVRNPDRNTIYDVLEKFQRKSFSEDSQLLLFFSGHGQFIASRSQGYFIPTDGKKEDRYADSYLPLNTIKNIANNINCNHILLAIDACYSGTINEGIALEKGKVGKRPGETNETTQEVFIRKTLQHKTRLYLTSGGKERTPDGDRYSPFTEHFLRALRNYQNNLVTFWDLLAQLKRADPMPHYGEFGYHDPGGDFLFVNNIPTVLSSLPTDPSGRSYKTVELNGKTWLQENLSFDVGEGSWCYDNDPVNCQKYGRLYNWEAVQKACNALGREWRLPTDEEWQSFAQSFGGYHDHDTYQNIGDPIKSYDALLKNGNSSFSAVLGGFCINGSFHVLGQYGSYWSGTESQIGGIWCYNFDGNTKILIRQRNKEEAGNSCRCIKD